MKKKTEFKAPSYPERDIAAQLANFDGKISIARAFPYGIQHVLAMFVANLAPIAIIAAAAGFDDVTTSILIQNAMIIAGIGTFIQLFPVWRVGARMPIVMGVSFTFVTVLCGIAAQYGYGAVVGAVIVGGIFEGVLGLFAKYWRKFITPIVSAVVVTSIGFSLLSVGAESFGGGSGAADFGSPENLILGFVSLIACLLFQALAKGSVKQLSVLFGLAVGYILALFMGKVDFSVFNNLAIFSLPTVMPFTPEFQPGAIIAVCLLYLVSAAETLGDTAALSSIGFKRYPTEREFSGAVAADGFVSSLAGVFGCSPLTSFAQNIGLIAMTKVVNRRAIACGAAILVLAGFIPAISAVFSSLPDAVLGGCTIMMFGSIILSGFQMIASAGFSQRNITIAAVSLAMGIGFTQVSDIFVAFPELLQNIFVGNSVALTFLSAVILSACLPKDTIIDGPLVHKERSEQEESQEQTESQDNSKPSREEQESSTVSKQSTKDHQEDSDNKH
ncbi:MAG: nucleobase:cation symporter-2 family protein [Eggerthellaceae bacterium]|nr:nucleobase:cation symporter-2 family protein [Eggerthellaceae bacterium]